MPLRADLPLTLFETIMLALRAFVAFRGKNEKKIAKLRYQAVNDF